MKLRTSAYLRRACVSLLLVGCGSSAPASPVGGSSGTPDKAGTPALGGSAAPTGTAGTAPALPNSANAGTIAASGGTLAAAGSSAGAMATSMAGRAGGAGSTQAGRSAAGGMGSVGQGGGNVGAAGSGADLEKFSFFVTSYAAMKRLSGSESGFGGDLRFGQTDGLSGADEICRQIAESSMKGSGSKGWHAFLSVTKGPDGKAINAIDRVGNGPWYDRLGRVVAQNKADLAQTRPKGADSAIINDLPNEDGVPNHAPDGQQLDNHDVLTGSSATGTLIGTNWSSTCHDWTSSTGADGKPRVGHSWPRMGGGRMGGGGSPEGGGMDNWMSALDEAGCAPGASLVEMGPPDPDIPTVGSGGGYGGIYCFALMP